MGETVESYEHAGFSTDARRYQRLNLHLERVRTMSDLGECERRLKSHCECLLYRLGIQVLIACPCVIRCVCWPVLRGDA
jgi:hypothetical protein